MACGIALLAWAGISPGVAHAQAQTDGVPNEKTLEDLLRNKPPPKVPPPTVPAAKKDAAATNASPASGSTPKPPAHRGTLIPMVVVSDAACALELNGDTVSVLEPGAVKKLSVWPGEQLVKCSSSEEPSEVYSAVHNIKAGEQTVLQITLAARVETARQKREAQTQSLAAEDELWAKAGPTGSAASLQAYVEKYPNGRFVDQAKGFLADSTRRAEEDADWQRVATSGQPAAVQSYVEKYPTGRYREAAQQRIEFLKRVPARPALPFPVGDDIWDVLENSTFYLDLPRRSHKVTVQISSTTRSERTKTASANRSETTTREILPLSDKCVVVHSVARKTEPAEAPPEPIDEYQCGQLKLETVVGGKVVRAASLSDVQTFIESDKAQRDKPACDVPSSGPASEFNAALTGAATRYGCAPGEYFFEDLGVWLYELGELDAEKQQYIVPSPGYHFESVADGDPGSKITTTYDSFSWTDAT
jgi:hypothetical protein